MSDAVSRDLVSIYVPGNSHSSDHDGLVFVQILRALKIYTRGLSNRQKKEIIEIVLSAIGAISAESHEYPAHDWLDTSYSAISILRSSLPCFYLHNNITLFTGHPEKIGSTSHSQRDSGSVGSERSQNVAKLDSKNKSSVGLMSR